MKKTIRVLTAALVVVSFSACGPKKVKEPPPSESGGDKHTQIETSGTDTTGRYTQADLDRVACLRQRTVYFDYDRSDIKSEAAAILQCHAKYLKDNPTARMTLEGHCDERGTREYNLGLGERRGNAGSQAIQGNGASSGQLNVVSYGEERPTCTESNEGCWSKNRRVEIVYTAK
jgi:peptidoglycan-associated lipoprotein